MTLMVSCDASAEHTCPHFSANELQHQCPLVTDHAAKTLPMSVRVDCKMSTEVGGVIC